MDKSPFLEIALEAAIKAGEVLIKYFNTDIKATLKEDRTPVTLADKEAEQIIIQTIKNKFPEHSFLGEESGKSDLKSEYLWIIDPLDGTKSFIRGIPLFATQIALIKNEEVILGVSNAPVIHELMYAEKGKGAYLNDREVKVAETDQIEKAYCSFGSVRTLKHNNLTDKFMKLATSIQWCRGIGDFWGYHLLAQGKIDIMFEPFIKIWDIAALKIIIEEAGGQMTDISGKAISLDTTSALASNGKMHKQVLNYFK